jgi:peptide/nickel transport system substrate-binding protein
MNKEPFGFYLLRLLLSIGLLIFIILLYWSSLLTEQDLKSIQTNVGEIKNELKSLRTDVDKWRQTAPQGVTQSSHTHFSTQSTRADPSLPNLLSEDLFYKTTLPKMLGIDFKPQGVRKEASLGKPNNLHPFSNWSHIATWISMCTVSLGTSHFGKYETMAPEMAWKMELRQNKEGLPEYWLHLRQDIFWQPLNPQHFANDVNLAPIFLQKHQVTAHDFKFYFDAVMNPHINEAQAVALRTYYGDIREIEVIDDFTLVVRWKTELVADKTGQLTPHMKYAAKYWTTALRPLATFVYQRFADGSKIIDNDSDPDTYRKNPIWAQNFSHHWAQNAIISCGPWIFDGLTEREIRFKRNADYYMPYAALSEGYEIKFKDSPDAIWEEFKSGALDLFEVPPNQLAEMERFLKGAPYQIQKQKGLGIQRLDYVNQSYSYIGWNEANHLFKNKKVRQALTMAIDRKRIIEQNLNGMAIETTGTFFRYSPSYDESIIPYPFDPQQARTLLAQEGWYDSNGDGIIDKSIDGKLTPFQFKLTYYVKNLTTKAICEYVATALKDIGIICQPNGVDLADLSAAFSDKSFDALSMAWGLGSPPEDPKQLWYTAQEKGSSNAIGFSNLEIDAIIDQLEYAYDPAKRLALYHRFSAVLYEEAPYTFLYTPKVALVYRDYLQNVFIPAERQDLIPGANVGEPQPNIFWIKQPN